MDVRRLAQDVRVRVAALTSACFVLASTGWLTWLYHLMGIAAPESVDVLTMGVGYLMQAVGIGTFALLVRAHGDVRVQRSVAACIVAYVACLVPATLSPALAPVLAFGYVANLLCGYAQGYYLYCLSARVELRRRGLVFGSAYALATGVGWLLSTIAGGALVRGVSGLVACAMLAVPAALLSRWPMPGSEWAVPAGDAAGPAGDAAGPAVDLPVTAPAVPAAAGDVPAPTPNRRTFAFACAVVALVSLTKGVGFDFPTEHLLAGVNLELSRLLYGVGLVVAGFITDRDRRLGAFLCAMALAMPFLMLALSGAVAPATLMWALGYLLTGFFSVFRVVLLADLAAASGTPLLAGLGLLLGRVGDSLGTLLCAALAQHPLVLIMVASVLFACTELLFIALYQRIYAPAAPPAPTEREVFERFAARHDLSAREREVLRLVLDERSNSEIAAELFVSDATVKFHVRNLLRKTGCKNRLELLALYAGN